MVTAETAVAIPVLVAVTLAMIWLVTVGIAQVKVTDAAREAARAAARGEPVDQAVSLARQAAPGADVAVDARGEEVTVTVSQQLSPLGLFQHLGPARVEGHAVAAAER